MATTTNYSWTTPDDTDLVKDGAAAIRTLGSSADTTVKNLNPGTTAGDIDYYTSGTAKARIAIGTAGQVLQVNSGATAPEWATPAAPASGLNLISTTSFTAVATQSFDNVFSATYENYVIIMRFHSSSNNATHFRLRASGTDATGGNYFSAVRSLSTGAVLTTEFAGSGSTYFQIGNLPTTSATTPQYLSMTLYNPYQTSSYKAQNHNYVQGSGDKGGYGWGSFSVSATAYDGFSIFNGSGGGATLTGTISIYGVSK